MKKTITLFKRIQITVESFGPHPFKSKAAKRYLAERILKESAHLDGNRKIARIKVLRAIAIDRGWFEEYGFGLKGQKQWVERNLADGGSGEIL